MDVILEKVPLNMASIRNNKIDDDCSQPKRPTKLMLTLIAQYVLVKLEILQTNNLNKLFWYLIINSYSCRYNTTPTLTNGT